MSERISIHALREEGDQSSSCPLTVQSLFLSTPSARRATRCGRKRSLRFSISIHALREEGDNTDKASISHIKRFLSTPSARRATQAVGTGARDHHYFYPRPPRGGRRKTPLKYRSSSAGFLSTPSARRATVFCFIRFFGTGYFYPRPPRGGRHNYIDESDDIIRFLSTPSARRATTEIRSWNAENDISIHALREEGDRISRPRLRRYQTFLSTPSARRATQGSW